MGQHLHELLGWHGPITHRQYAAWQRWLADDLNRPSRDNYYQMQTTQYAIRPHLKEGAAAPQLSDFLIPFGPPDGESQESLEETDGPPIVTEAMILQVQKDMAVFKSGGKGVERRWVDKHGNPVEAPKGA